MNDFDEDAIYAQIEELGYEVDCGNLIGGPFIDDGTVRIYAFGSLEVLGQGDTLEEAYRDMQRREMD